MNIILVITDSLRADHVGCYGNGWIRTPSLDRLARESVLFENATPEGLPTIPVRRAIHTGVRTFPWDRHSLWKGEYIQFMGWHPLAESDVTLAEILREKGYVTALVSDTYHLFKPRENFHRSFVSYQWIRGQEADPYKSAPREVDAERYLVPAMRNTRAHRMLIQYLRNVAGRRSEEDYFAPRVFREGMNWLEQNRDAEKFFLCLDVFDPHEPWDPPGYYTEMYDPGYTGKEVILPMYGPPDYLTESELKHVRALYAGEVTMVDRWLGIFLDRVEDLGLLEDTLVVFISDHGHPLGEHGLMKKVTSNLYPELLDIPFLIRHPGGVGAGSRVKGFVQNQDLFPTVLGLMGFEALKSVDSFDLWPLVTGEQTSVRDYAISAFHDYAAVRDWRWHYITDSEGGDQRLYDLESDSSMKINIAGKQPKVLEEMRRRLARLVKKSTWFAPKTDADRWIWP